MIENQMEEFDGVGRRIKSAEMSEELKDAISYCYGMLWLIEAENQLVHSARHGLLRWLTSGSRLTFESGMGFPSDRMHASLAYANRNFRHS